METVQIENYLLAIRKARTDNEKFAALLMVAKVTKESSCDKAVKRQILEAVGPKFFSRLFKTRNVPEGCPDNIFKSVALSILSALSGDPDVACSPALTDNVSSFNMIVLINPSDAEVEDRQLVDDTYQCYNSLCGSVSGQESLVKARSLSALSQVVTEQMYGFEKAMDVLVALLSSAGPEAWVGCEPALHSLMGHFAKEFKSEMGARKFEVCKTLIFLLTTMPRNLMKTIDPPWAEDIVAGLDSILRSKLGSPQREPALKLTAMLIDVCGIQCVLPPAVSDSKLFLLITHLSCVEVRMVLEDSDINVVFQKGRLLSSCYSILETIINHMTAGPSLQLDDRQVMQLHSAIVGAFAAVLHFLKRVSDDSKIQWGSVVLATVRVLAAWLSEETSALRNEVYELLPFLVDISKKCVPPYEEFEKTNKALMTSSQGENDKKSNGNNSEVVVDSLSHTLDKALHMIKPSEEEVKDDNITETVDMKRENTKNHNSELMVELDRECEQNIGWRQNVDNCVKNVLTESKHNIDNGAKTVLTESNHNVDNSLKTVFPESQETVTEVEFSDASNAENNTETMQVKDNSETISDPTAKKHVHFNPNQSSGSGHVTNSNHVTGEESSDVNIENNLKHSSHEDQSKSTERCIGNSLAVEMDINNSALNTDKQPLISNKHSDVKTPEQKPSSLAGANSALIQGVTIDSCVNDSSVKEESEMTEEELQDLHIRVDIFRFLLPGLCHLTSEDLPRMVLIQEGILALLDLYMWRQWNLFTQSPQSREVQSSLVIICNILLNLVITEPKLVVEKEEFSHVLLLVAKSVLELEMADCLVVWSHMVTLGLMLMRALSKKTESFLEVESVNRFFVSAVRFLSGAYTVEYKKKMATGITISDSYRQTWDQICQTWFLSMQAFCACVPLFSELPNVVLKTGWVPSLVKSLSQVKGRGVEEETRSCFLLLLTTVANNDKASKDVIREKGGEELARLYRSKDLEEALKKK